MCGINPINPMGSVSDLAMIVQGVVQLASMFEASIQEPQKREEDLAVDVLIALKQKQITREKALKLLSLILEKEMKSANPTQVQLPSLNQARQTETRLMDMLAQMGL